MAFEALDIYAFDELLTDDERQVRDAVRRWVEERYLPIVDQHHRAGTFPVDMTIIRSLRPSTGYGMGKK